MPIQGQKALVLSLVCFQIFAFALVATAADQPDPTNSSAPGVTPREGKTLGVGTFQDHTDSAAFAAAAGNVNTITFQEVPVGTVLSNQYPDVTFTDGNDLTATDAAFLNDGVGVIDGNSMTLVFSQPIMAVGLHFPGAAKIEVYDVLGGILLHQSADFGGTGTGFFGGVTSPDTEFTAVVISDWLAVPGYYDDLVYGDLVPVELQSFSVE